MENNNNFSFNNFNNPIYQEQGQYNNNFNFMNPNNNEENLVLPHNFENEKYISSRLEKKAFELFKKSPFYEEINKVREEIRNVAIYVFEYDKNNSLLNEKKLIKNLIIRVDQILELYNKSFKNDEINEEGVLYNDVNNAVIYKCFENFKRDINLIYKNIIRNISNNNNPNNNFNIYDYYDFNYKEKKNNQFLNYKKKDNINFNNKKPNNIIDDDYYDFNDKEKKSNQFLNYKKKDNTNFNNKKPNNIIDDDYDFNDKEKKSNQFLNYKKKDNINFNNKKPNNIIDDDDDYYKIALEDYDNYDENFFKGNPYKAISLEEGLIIPNREQIKPKNFNKTSAVNKKTKEEELLDEYYKNSEANLNRRIKRSVNVNKKIPNFLDSKFGKNFSHIKHFKNRLVNIMYDDVYGEGKENAPKKVRKQQTIEAIKNKIPIEIDNLETDAKNFYNTQCNKGKVNREGEFFKLTPKEFKEYKNLKKRSEDIYTEYIDKEFYPKNYGRANFGHKFRRIEKIEKELKEKLQVTREETDLLKNINSLKKDTKEFYNERRSNKEKVSLKGHVKIDKLNLKEKQKYEDLIIRRKKLLKEYRKIKKNFLSFWDSKFSYKFSTLLKLKTILEERLKKETNLENRTAIENLINRTEHLKRLIKDFYKKLCINKKIDETGQVIDNKLNENERKYLENLEKRKQEIYDEKNNMVSGVKNENVKKVEKESKDNNSNKEKKQPINNSFYKEFYNSAFKYGFLNMLLLKNTLLNKKILTKNSAIVGEINKLMDEAKKFYDDLKTKGKVDDFGNLCNLDEGDNKKYSEFKERNANLEKRLEALNVKKPSFEDSKFGRYFKYTIKETKANLNKTLTREALSEEKINKMVKLIEKTEKLNEDLKKFYQKMCDANKVNENGELINLNAEEEKEHEKLKSTKDEIDEEYSNDYCNNSSTKNKKSYENFKTPKKPANNLNNSFNNNLNNSFKEEDSYEYDEYEGDDELIKTIQNINKCPKFENSSYKKFVNDYKKETKDLTSRFNSIINFRNQNKAMEIPLKDETNYKIDKSQISIIYQGIKKAYYACVKNGAVNQLGEIFNDNKSKEAIKESIALIDKLIKQAKGYLEKFENIVNLLKQEKRKKLTNENLKILLKDFNSFNSSVKNNNSENEDGLYIKNLKTEKQNSSLNITSNNSYEDENFKVPLKNNFFNSSVKNNNSENEGGLYNKSLKIEKQNSSVYITSNNFYANENLRDYLEKSDAKTIIRNYKLEKVDNTTDKNEENLKRNRAFAKNPLFKKTYNSVKYLKGKKENKVFNEEQNNLFNIINALLDKTQDIYWGLYSYGYVSVNGEVTHDEALRDLEILNDIMDEYIDDLYEKIGSRREK